MSNVSLMLDLNLEYKPYCKNEKYKDILVELQCSKYYGEYTRIPHYVVKQIETIDNDLYQTFIALVDNNNINGIKGLIYNGNVNTRGSYIDYCSNSLLHYACYKKSIDVIKYLLECQVNINTVNMYDDSPLHFTLFGGYNNHSRERCIDNNINQETKILISSGANKDISESYYNTPLINAITNKATTQINYLLGIGAHINVKNVDKCTGLIVAFNNKMYNLVIRLLEADADIYYTNNNLNFVQNLLNCIIECDDIDTLNEYVKIIDHINHYEDSSSTYTCDYQIKDCYSPKKIKVLEYVFSKMFDYNICVGFQRLKRLYDDVKNNCVAKSDEYLLKLIKRKQINFNDDVFVVINTTYGGYSFTNKAKQWLKCNYNIDYTYNMSRHDPRLLELIKELGPDAYKSSETSICQIPKIFENCYEIDEYDGNESVKLNSVDLVMHNYHDINVHDLSLIECKEKLIDIVSTLNTEYV